MSQGVAQRSEPPRAGVAHAKAMELFRRHASETGRGFLSYPRTRQILSWLFHFDKKQARAFLKEMEEAGLVTTHGFKGIKILEERR